MDATKCINFIDCFKNAQERQGLYVTQERRSVDSQEVSCFAIGMNKPNHFKIKQISQTATECFNYLASDNCSIALRERVGFLTDLKQALSSCTSRIEASISRRWWYRILHFFGYQAKCPKDIQALISSAGMKIDQLNQHISNFSIPSEQAPSLTEESRVPIVTEPELESSHSSTANGNENSVANPDSLFNPLSNDNESSVVDSDSLSNPVSNQPLPEPLDPLVSQFLQEFQEVAQFISQIVIDERGSRSMQACRSHFMRLLKNPELKEALERSANFKNQFFSFLSSVQARKILSDAQNANKSELDLYLKTVLEFIFTSASDEHLKAFIDSQVLISSVQSYPGCSYVKASVLQQLTDDQKRRLSPLLTEDHLLPLAEAFKEHRKTVLALVKEMNDRSPDWMCWNTVISCHTNSPLAALRPYVSVWDLGSFLKTSINMNLPDSQEKFSTLVKQISVILQFFSSIAEERATDMMMLELKPVLESIGETSMAAFTQAFALGKDGKGYNYDYIILAAILRLEKSQFSPMLREYMRLSTTLHNQDRLISIHQLLRCLSTKEQAAVFIEECKQLPDPLKTIYLRSLANLEKYKTSSSNIRLKLENLDLEELKQAFLEAGLNWDHYTAPVSRELLKNAVKKQRYVDQIITFNNLEHMIAGIQQEGEKCPLLCRSFIGGIDVSKSVKIKNAYMSQMTSPEHEQTIRKAFEDCNLDFDKWNCSVSLDEFLMEKIEIQ